MSRLDTQRRIEIRDALAVAFPLATWSISQCDVRGDFGTLRVLMTVQDLYRRGCSEIICYRKGTSSAWSATARCAPTGRRPSSIVAAVRRALKETARARQTANDAAMLLGET